MLTGAHSEEEPNRWALCGSAMRTLVVWGLVQSVQKDSLECSIN